MCVRANGTTMVSPTRVKGDDVGCWMLDVWEVEKSRTKPGCVEHLMEHDAEPLVSVVVLPGLKHLQPGETPNVPPMGKNGT